MEGLYLQSASQFGMISMVNYARTRTNLQPLIQTGARLGSVLFAVKQLFFLVYFVSSSVVCVAKEKVSLGKWSKNLLIWLLASIERDQVLIKNPWEAIQTTLTNMTLTFDFVNVILQ